MYSRRTGIWEGQVSESSFLSRTALARTPSPCKLVWIKIRIPSGNNMVPISLASQPIVSQAALSAAAAAFSAGVGAVGAAEGASAAAATPSTLLAVLPATIAALRGGAGTAAATEAAVKAFDLTRARIRLEGLSAYGVRCTYMYLCVCSIK